MGQAFQKALQPPRFPGELSALVGSLFRIRQKLLWRLKVKMLMGLGAAIQPRVTSSSVIKSLMTFVVFLESQLWEPANLGWNLHFQHKVFPQHLTSEEVKHLL